MKYTLTEIKPIILNYIIEEFGSNTSKQNRIKHYSYCMFPETDCSCNDIKEINYDTPLMNGGYIDSFSMVMVRSFLETRFGTKISDTDATPTNFNTINKMADLVINSVNI